MGTGDLGMVIEKYDLLRAKAEFRPEFTKPPGVIRIDDDPEIEVIPELDLARPEQGRPLRVKKLIPARQGIGIVDPAGLLRAF